MTVITRYVTLAVASVDTPASTIGTLPATSHLAAIAMLVAERHNQDEWRFVVHAEAIGAGESEDRLLAWASTALPDRGTVLGWQLAETVLPPLLAASEAGDPVTGRTFLDRLLRLVTAPSIDLAVEHGGAGAPPSPELVLPGGIGADTLDAAGVESAWAFGHTRRLVAHVEALAIATWRLWLARSSEADLAARVAFEAWVAS